MSNFGYWIFGRDMSNVDVDGLKKNGITDIFLNYYAFELYGDRVKSWIEKVNGKNIRVHIWVQCFYGDNGWINPVSNQTFLKNKINEIKKYVAIKGVGGIHLDYLRYPGTAYKTTGGAEAITKFVKEVKGVIPKGMLLSCAVMPEEDCKYYYGQDIKALGSIVDMVIPMQYKGNYEAGTKWLQSTTKSFSSKAKIWSGLQTYKSDDDTTKLSATELLNDAKSCLSAGAKGVVLFRYGLVNAVNFTTLKQSAQVAQSTRLVSNDVVKKSVIYKIAKEVKDTVIKNKKIPSKSNGYNYAVYTYLLSKTIVNPNKDIKKINVKNPSSPTGTNINMKVYKQDYIDMAKRVANYIEKNGQLPNYVSYKNYKIRVRVYVDAFARIVNYYYSHENVLPNYVVVNNNNFK